MPRRRAHIPLKTKLAAALRDMMVVGPDGKLERAIPYEHAKSMTADEVLSLFVFDHGVQHAIGGSDEHWNLTPRFIAEHRRKTAEQDIPQLAKTDRITKAQSEFVARVLAKAGGEAPAAPDKPKRKFPKRETSWPKRSFPKRDRKAPT